MINQKGQALVELAVCGVILLFCLGILIQYGIEANYQQNLQMQVFRKATQAAYYKTGPAATISLSMTKDKPVPDPRDMWGFPERRPVTAGASATWDTNLQSLYIDDFGETPEDKDLPQTIIEINKTKALRPADLNDDGIDNIGEAQGAYKTAIFRVEENLYGRNEWMVVLDNTAADRLSTHAEYRVIPVEIGDIRVKTRPTTEQSPGRKNAYFLNGLDGLIYTITSADIDYDGKLEAIIAVKGKKEEGGGICDENGDCGRVVAVRYLDFQEGAIDTDYTVINPWETNKADASLAARQGLLFDYTAEKNNNNTLSKTQLGGSVTTATSYGSSEITHTIGLNPNAGRVAEDVPTTFAPGSRNY